MGGSGSDKSTQQVVSGVGNVVISHVTNSTITVSLGDQAPKDVALRPGWWELPAWLAQSSLSALLKPDVGVVPFIDVDGRLERLTEWATAGPPVAVALVAGVAGSGKTRLAGQLCRTLTDDGWLAGFVRRDAQPDEIGRLAHLPVARCVVVDYAEAKPDVAATVVDRLIASATDEHPVRMLLLTRATADGSHDVRPLLRGRSSYLDLLLDQAQWELLAAPAWSQLDRRRELYTVAAAALADRLGVPPPSAPDELSSDLYDRPLTIAVAAAVACLDPATAPTEQRQLLDRLLELEAEHWRRTAERVEVKATPDLRRLIAAFATLAGATTRDEAVELLRRLADLSDAMTERRSELAGWMHAASPGTSYWNPVEPDLIGEHLVATILGDQPDTLAAAIDGRDPDAVRQPITLLARAAPNHSHVAVGWADLIDERFVGLVNAAATQASNTTVADLFDPSLAATLAFTVTQLDLTLDTLKAASNRLLEPNLVLNPLRLAISEQLAARYRVLAHHDRTYLPDLATALNNLANRLAAVGRNADALTAIRQAVEHDRTMAGADPAAYLPDLAMSLNNLALRLGAVGKHDDALTAIEEAVTVRRTLVQIRPDRFRPALATSLNNLSAGLAAVGRYADALTAIEEAVEIRRNLASSNPAAYLPDVATSLNNLSARLGDTGRRADALAVIEEAIDIRRNLAGANPAAHLPDLATSLNNHAVQLAASGRNDDALTAIDEAVGVYRRLTDAGASYVPDLAMALNNLSNALADVGRNDDALTAIEEAVEIRRNLAANNPAAHLPGLGQSLNNLSSVLTAMSRNDDALTAIEEAADIRRKLATVDPAAHVPGLAQSLTNLSILLAHAGRDEDALAAVTEAVERVVPVLEDAWYVLPDGGHLLTQTYIMQCTKLDLEPDGQLVARLREILRAGVTS